jgi:hypothetical protein
MKKIPTLFVRNPEDRAHVLPEVTPGCEWVLAGEGAPTRKYDGTCVMYDGSAWWARREVKPGKNIPPAYQIVEHDETTGKLVGWEPIEQSAFAKYHSQALDAPWGIADAHPSGQWTPPMRPVADATYELCGAKVNGNPERIEDGHLLIRHGYTAAVDRDEMASLTASFEDLRMWLHAHARWEGIVWHHPDGRMAKLKKRDFIGPEAQR